MREAIDEPGFADPVGDAQAVFRVVLTALSEPGRVLTVPSGLGAARAVLLALADPATPVWLDATARRVAAWLRFHTGAPMVEAIGSAGFALVMDAGDCPDLDRFDGGSEAFPDRSATLVIEVAGLAEGGDLRLAGPGIAEARWLRVEGLSGRFWAQWSANRARFPAGIDVVLTCGDLVAGLPRTVSVEVACMSR